MKTIIETNEITAAFENFEPSKDGAFATGRLIQGADTPLDPQEWCEPGEINGAPAKVYYIFEGKDAQYEDADFMPFDADHIHRIEIAEKDKDGDYENL